ncbi:hypothetical protein PHJA_001393700 [Phtheirospermum japonicum]|uniref:Agouti signaling protein n=1 Tax=Phtheirospermum japonicum TaxID=374723 RepID=A0A830CBG7_9LAMI|nr:hypothetical protein PHJA_001393700 [Phtheirospermum japonicum]
MITSFLLAIMLVFHSHMQEAQAIRTLMAKTRIPASTIPSASQSLKNLHVKEKNPFKKEKTSVPRIPPSRSNPTQNK